MITEGQLSIPQSVTLAPSGLTIGADLSFDEWAKLGETLKVVHRATLFWIGDWLNYGERKYGEMFAQAIDATYYSLSTLQTAKWVSDRIETSMRMEDLTWNHHQVIAPLEPNEQGEWLDRAVRGEDGRPWSVRKLRAELQQQRSEREDHESKVKATISIEIEGNQVKVSLNCDNLVLEALLAPEIDILRTVVWEGMNPALNN